MLNKICKLNNYIYKNRGLAIKCTGFLLCIGILALCASCGEQALFYDEETSMTESEEAESISADNPEIYITEDAEKELMMVVHLCGAVNNPGVYELNVDSRVIDGIIKAGGFAEDACEEALNLASPIEDGSRIYVPSFEEAAGELSNSVATGNDKYIQKSNLSAGLDSEDKDGLVNINTAGQDRLMTLSGIGESRAKSIIAYREEHGAFKSIEDIMKVSGIKEGAFAKIKDYITVN